MTYQRDGDVGDDSARELFLRFAIQRCRERHEVEVERETHDWLVELRLIEARKPGYSPLRTSK